MRVWYYETAQLTVVSLLLYAPGDRTLNIFVFFTFSKTTIWLPTEFRSSLASLAVFLSRSPARTTL